jgi:hypothetical protein
MNRFRIIVTTLLIMLSLVGGVIFAADIVLSINIDDTNGKAKAHLDDVADYTGWTPTVPDPNNPTGPPIPNISKKNWVEKKIREWFKESVKAQRASKKAEKSRTDELIAVEAEVVFK